MLTVLWLTICVDFVLGCGDAESGEGGAASASPRVEEPPPLSPASTGATTAPAPVPPDVSPTADSWEAEADADDALLTPDNENEAEEDETDQQVYPTVICMSMSVLHLGLYSWDISNSWAESTWQECWY